jgi:Ca2+-binding EF-hand superfamily protein
MTLKSLLITTALLALAGPAFAQQAPMPGQPGAAAAPQGQRQGPFERMDANRDGVLTRDEVRVARTVTFTRLDANRDGFLVREEMPSPPMGGAAGRGGRMPGGDGQGANRPAHGGELLRRADTNNDGNVTRAEYDAAWAAANAAKAGVASDRKARAFARLDANSDGTITRAEADAARAQTQFRPPEGPDGMGAQPQGVQGGARPSADTNNDQKISLAEWLARPDPLFDRGDANNDGRVTRDEAAAFVRQGRGGRPSRPW